MNPLTEIAIKMFRSTHEAAVNNAKMEALKLSRDGSEFDLNLHRETCQACHNKTVEELAALFGCANGLKLSRDYIDKNRAVRNGGI